MSERKDGKIIGCGGKRRFSGFHGQELLSGVLVDRDWRVTVEDLGCLAAGNFYFTRTILTLDKYRRPVLE